MFNMTQKEEQLLEDYCSFEIAKLLKEKGFNIKCNTYFISDNDIAAISILRDFNNNGVYLSAPSQSLVLKWLRKVHNYYIQIMLDSWACGGHLGYYVVIQNLKSDFEIMLQDVVDEVFYQTYEEAVEAAIKYTLKNLI